jgi:hypothetical protein
MKLNPLILWLLAGPLVGLMVIVGPTDMAWWNATWTKSTFLAAYQLFVGVMLCWLAQDFNSWYDSRLHWTNKKWRIPCEMLWLAETLLAVLVITNIGRYGDILNRVGSWPLWLVGGSLVLLGSILLTGYLLKIPAITRRTA